MFEPVNPIEILVRASAHDLVRSFAKEDKMQDQYNFGIEKSYQVGKTFSFLYGSFIGATSMFIF